jgi:hypothetical protein
VNPSDREACLDQVVGDPHQRGLINADGSTKIALREWAQDAEPHENGDVPQLESEGPGAREHGGRGPQVRHAQKLAHCEVGIRRLAHDR